MVGNHKSQSAEFWYLLMRIIEGKIMKRGVSKWDVTDMMVLRELEKIIYEEKQSVKAMIDQNRNNVKRYLLLKMHSHFSKISLCIYSKGGVHAITCRQVESYKKIRKKWLAWQKTISSLLQY